MIYRGICAVIGNSLIFFAMGLYLSSGNMGIYMTSYLRAVADSHATLSDSVWFLYVVGISALMLPLGGFLDTLVGARIVCIIGGLLQSFLIFLTYFTIDINFSLVVLTYGGAFLLSFGISYTAPLATINKWFPERNGLVTGIACASLALAPCIWTPLITNYVNPLNLPANSEGYFEDKNILRRTKDSLFFQCIASITIIFVGVILLFPPPKVENIKYHKKVSQNINNKQPEYEEETGLSPKYAIRTCEFYLLSTKIMLTELVFFYLLFVYKPFGQTKIKDDQFLSKIGAYSALANTIFRLVMGYFKDTISYKMCCIPMSAISTTIVATLPYTLNYPMVYAFFVIAGVGMTGSQYALMPSAITDIFGEKYASLNIGIVYTATVIADVFGALGSSIITDYIGWTGMISLIAFSSFIGIRIMYYLKMLLICVIFVSIEDFLATFWLPNNPRKRLQEKLACIEQNEKLLNEIIINEINEGKNIDNQPISFSEA